MPGAPPRTEGARLSPTGIQWSGREGRPKRSTPRALKCLRVCEVGQVRSAVASSWAKSLKLLALPREPPLSRDINHLAEGLGEQRLTALIAYQGGRPNPSGLPARTGEGAWRASRFYLNTLSWRFLRREAAPRPPRIALVVRPQPCFTAGQSRSACAGGAHETVFMEPARHHRGLSEPAAPTRSACQRPAPTPTAESGVSPTNCTGRRRYASGSRARGARRAWLR